MKKCILLLLTLYVFSACKKDPVEYILNVSVTPAESGIVVPASGTYKAGEIVSLTARPSAEYIFKEWQGSISSTNNPLSITMDSSKSVTAVFEKRQYPLSLVVEGSGMVKEEIVLTQAMVSSYPSGTTVKLTAVPDTGWKFDSWSGDTVLSANPFTINFKKAYSIKAKFVEEPIKFSINLDTGLYYVDDVLPLQINLTSGKLKTGYTISIETVLKDSSKRIFKTDTSFGGGSLLSLKIPGHKVVGDYSASIKIKSKGDTTNVATKTINFSNTPILPAINSEILPNINWNDVVQGKSNFYDFNGDAIPDIISYDVSNKWTSPNPPIFSIYDLTSKLLFTFNVKEFNNSIRDSLNNITYDFADLNDDGKIDIGLTYSGEWWNNNKTISIGSNSYLLINKGNMQFETKEIIDDAYNFSVGISFFDWDFDGKIDILTSAMQDSIYYKNIGNGKFEKRQLKPLFISSMFVKGLDFDKDRKDDYINFWVNQIDEFGNWHDKNNFTQTLTVVTSSGFKNYPVVGKLIPKYIFNTKNTTSAERINMVDGDGDGDLDLIVGSLQNDNGTWYCLQEYFENTGVQFEFRKDFIEIDKTLRAELQTWAYDIDKDGMIDLYYPTYLKSKLNSPQGPVFWWKNTKSGFKIMKKFRLVY